MNKIGFNLHPDFIEQLWQKIEVERSWAYKSVERITIGGYSFKNDPILKLFLPTAFPNKEQLTEFIEIAFWASIRKEEGRELKFAVGYHNPINEHFSYYSFEQSLAYNVRNITKLAPAIGSFEKAMLVGHFEKDKMEIWGFSDRSIAPLVIKVIDPGQLIISFFNNVLLSNTNLAVISGDQSKLIAYDKLNYSSFIWETLEPSDKKANYSIFSDLKIKAILEIAKIMRSFGHGGALIIVPDDNGWLTFVDNSMKFAPKSRFTDATVTLDTLIKSGEQDKTINNRIDEEKYLESYLNKSLRTIAQMTCVDGATIITRNLEVLGFGVKLIANTKPEYLFKLDPLGNDRVNIEEIKIEQLGGTRHQSAAQFVFNQPESIAIVVSQDGFVTSIAWGKTKSGKLVLAAITRLELTLF
jgi:hypothetical protein